MTAGTGKIRIIAVTAKIVDTLYIFVIPVCRPCMKFSLLKAVWKYVVLGVFVIAAVENFAWSQYP